MLVWVKPMVTGVVAEAVGVPVISPVAAFRLRPVGSGEAVQVPVGFPVAVRVVAYGSPTLPPGSEEVLITGLAGGGGAAVTVTVTGAEVAGALRPAAGTEAR